MAKKSKRRKKRKALRDQYRYVLRTLSGKNLDPVKITRSLGLEPDWSSVPGEVFRGKSGKVYKYPIGTWCIASRLRRNSSLENHVKDLIDQIQPKKNTLLRILKNAKGELTIAVRPHKEVANANYYFPAELIREFTSLGIDIHFSFYDPHTWEEFCEKG